MKVTTICGCYARKSTDEGDRAADAKSVTRQVQRAKEFAKARGWRFDDALVFSDDGISGGEFRSHAEERHRRGIAGRSRMAHFGRGARATRGRPGAAQACASRPAFATCKSHTGWVDGLHRVAGAN